MNLNPDQQAAVDRILHTTLETRTTGITLVGAGGTGKTFCIMHAAQRMLDAGLKVLFTAPTNKAVKQLEKAARDFGLSMNNVAFQTVHSALGLALLPNEDRKHAVRAGKGVVGVFDVMIVDECSMLSRYALYDHLLPECQNENTKLVFMGDDLQLPPVKEPVSPTFTEFETLRLEQNMRQADGELLSMNGMLRAAMMANKPFKAPEVSGQQVVEIKAADFLKEVLDAFTLETDLESQRVLAWTNKRVDQVNAAIRKKLYGEGVEPFEVGERVVTGAPVKDDEGQILLGTDEECLVAHVDTGSHAYSEITGKDYRSVQLVLEPVYIDGQVVVNVLHADSREEFQDDLERLANRARSAKDRRLWGMFWHLKETFADVRFCYCITVHRSQGSTFDRVFVDVKDILRNSNRIERQRLLYVSYSRPRHQLLTNKSKYAA